MVRRATAVLLPAFVMILALATSAPAQGRLSGRGPLEIHGFALAGSMTFTARDSFEAILGSPSGSVIGGGGRVTLPVGVFVQLTALSASESGERVFIGPGNEVFRLGIPTTVNIKPFEITAGWRFRHLTRRVVPYAGAGWTSVSYEETSAFAEPSENVADRFSGFHVLGGADVRVVTWLHVGAEVAWASVPDALGTGGVSEAFGDDNLGGTSVRLKISVGR